MKQVILTSISLEELVQLLTNEIKDLLQKKNEVVIKQVFNDEQKSDYLTKQEVADLCKVKSLTTLWNWKQKGKLVPKKMAGRKILYLRQDVEDFLNRINWKGGQNED